MCKHLFPLRSLVSAIGLAAIGLTGSLPGVAPPAGAAEIPLKVIAPDGVALSGTLRLPEGTGPFPAIVFTHGSGPTSRQQPGYVDLARRFAERGIAGLVFDKRGLGESEGVYVEAPDLTVPAGDVVAWVDLLRQRSDIRADCIGVFGWSQGGWIGPLAASRSPDLSFVISIVGPGVSPLEQNIFDKTNQFRAQGGTATQTAQFSQVIRSVWTYIVTGEHRTQAQAAWDSVKDEPWFSERYQGPPMMDREALLQHPRMTHFVEHSSYEPVPILEALTVPLLCVFGTADPIVPLEASVEAIDGAARRSGNEAITIKVFEGADHGMQVTRPDGSRDFAPGFWKYVLDWADGACGP